MQKCGVMARWSLSRNSFDLQRSRQTAVLVLLSATFCVIMKALGDHCLFSTHVGLFVCLWVPKTPAFMISSSLTECVQFTVLADMLREKGIVGSDLLHGEKDAAAPTR